MTYFITSVFTVVVIVCKQVMTQVMKAVSSLFWCLLSRDEVMWEDRCANRVPTRALRLVISLDTFSPWQLRSNTEKC